MPTAKTKTSKSKKPLPKVAKVSSPKKIETKSSKLTLSELKKKATDPKNRKSIYIGIIIILLAVIIYFGKNLVIAATVNGQPVSRLSIIKELEKQSGKVVLDNTITRMLVLQEAEKKNITATQKEIDAEINKIKKQFKDQGQDFDGLLAAQGLTLDKLKDEVKIQVIVTKILGDQAKVTDKEFNDFLTKNKDLLANEKDQNKAKADLRTQLEQQKLAQKYQEWMTKVKKEAKINYFVNY